MQNIIKLSAALTLLLQPLASADEKYPIKLVRPHVVGKTYEISSVAQMKNSTELKIDGNTVDAAPEANTVLISTLEATQKVLVVDGTGKVESCLLTVKKLTSRSAESDEPKSVIDPGTEVSVEIGLEDVEFTVGGKKPSEQQALVLNEFFDPRDESTDDDILFGTKNQVAVGESWKIDSKAAAEGLSKHGMKIAEEGIRGRMKLFGIVKKGGVDCLDIRGEIELVEFSPTLPDGLKLRSSGGRLKLEGFFPIDTNLQPSEMAVQMGFKMNAGRKDGQRSLELITSGLVKNIERKKLAQ